jgi:hypothetical protein
MARPKNSAQPSDAAGTVTVACRLPGGLRFENVPGVPGGVLMIKGSNDEWALKMVEDYEAHGLTSGVPQEAWDHIVNHPYYKDSKWMRSGAVFATTKAKDAIKEAQDRGQTKTGFEGLDPEKLPAKIEDAAKAEAAKDKR